MNEILDKLDELYEIKQQIENGEKNAEARIQLAQLTRDIEILNLAIDIMSKR